MIAVSTTTDQDKDERRSLAVNVRRHREMLIFALVVGLTAPLLRVYPPDRVGWRWSSDLLLPPLCAVRQYCGINCPGCGMTRSIVYLAEGDLAASWRMHRLGFVLGFLIVAQIPYRLLALLYPRQAIMPGFLTSWIVGGLISLLFINWFFNLLTSTG